MSKPRQHPSESYAARAARGRVQVTVTCSADLAGRFRAYAEARGWTLGEALAALLPLER